MTDTAPGDLFVVRNVANRIPVRYDADASVGAVIEYAVEQLGVREVIVCGHDGCGGVQAAFDGLPGIEAPPPSRDSGRSRSSPDGPAIPWPHRGLASAWEETGHDQSSASHGTRSAVARPSFTQSKHPSRPSAGPQGLRRASTGGQATRLGGSGLTSLIDLEGRDQTGASRDRHRYGIRLPRHEASTKTVTGHQGRRIMAGHGGHDARPFLRTPLVAPEPAVSPNCCSTRDPGGMVMALALADERIDLAAAVPRVRFRRFRGREDFEAMSAVTFACQEADGRDGRSAQTLTSILESVMAGPELADGILLAEVDGIVIGFGDGYCWGDNEGIGRMLEHGCRVLPAWRSKGIGRVLLREAQAAALRRASTRPRTDLPVVFTSFVNETEAATVRLLTRDGYRPARYEFSMVRPRLDDPPDEALPPGIELRPVRPEDSPAVLQALDEAFRDEPTYAPQTDEQLETWAASPIGGQLDVWQVAWAGDEIVAGVLGHIDEDENRLSGRRRGYTQNIFARRPWRGRGLASALISRNLHELARRGMTEAALFVDADNPSAALRIYERAGFVRDKVLVLFARPVESA